jgi:hypothetical protein
MHSFAQAEDQLNLLLALYIKKHVFPAGNQQAQTEDETWPYEDPLASQAGASLSLLRTAVLRAVLGGSRFASLRATLKRLMRATGANASTAQEVDRIFAQFGEIQYVRDRLAHNSAVPSLKDKDCWFYTSNQSTVNDDQQWEMIYFKPSMLVAMERDLNVGLDILSDVLDVHSMQLKLKRNDEWLRLMKTPEMEEAMRDRLGPWHFKPSQLKRVGPRWRAAPQPR